MAQHAASAPTRDTSDRSGDLGGCIDPKGTRAGAALWGCHLPSPCSQVQLTQSWKPKREPTYLAEPVELCGIQEWDLVFGDIPQQPQQQAGDACIVPERLQQAGQAGQHGGLEGAPKGALAFWRAAPRGPSEYLSSKGERRTGSVRPPGVRRASPVLPRCERPRIQPPLAQHINPGSRANVPCCGCSRVTGQGR